MTQDPLMRANEQFPKGKSHLRIENTKTIGKRNVLLKHTKTNVLHTIPHFWLTFTHNKLNQLLFVYKTFQSRQKLIMVLKMS